MTLKQMTLFCVAITATKNKDSIRMINAVSFPQLKEKDRKALMKSLLGEHQEHVQL